MSSAQPHSIWLCPEQAASEAFTQAISRVSRTAQTPHFQPHVTLLGDLSGSVPASIAACEGAVDALSGVTARVTRVETTDDYFMSLYLKLDLQPDIRDLRNTLGLELTGATPPEYYPHLSLGYGLRPADRRQVQAETWIQDFVGLEFRLSRLALVRSAKSVPIEEWSALWTSALGR